MYDIQLIFITFVDKTIFGYGFGLHRFVTHRIQYFHMDI